MLEFILEYLQAINILVQESILQLWFTICLNIEESASVHQLILQHLEDAEVVPVLCKINVSILWTLEI